MADVENGFRLPVNRGWTLKELQDVNLSDGRVWNNMDLEELPLLEIEGPQYPWEEPIN